MKTTLFKQLILKLLALAVCAAVPLAGGGSQRKERVPPYLQLGRALDDPKEVRRLLLKGIDPNAGGKYSSPPLFSGYQYPQSSRLILLAGADPNIRDERGFTPLMELCDLYTNPGPGGGAIPTRADVKSYAALLVLAGADVEAKDKEGRTPIIVMRNDLDLQRYLRHLEELQRDAGIMARR